MKRLAVMATIQELREARGWTRAQLEARTDHVVSHTTIWRIESGETIPFRGTRVALARALGVELDAIEWPVRPHAAGTDQ